MRLLFVHDHRFFHGAEGSFHTAGSFPASVWQRYLRHFDELLVLARSGGKLPPGSNLATSNHPAVDFEFAPSLGSLRQLIRPSNAIRRQMKQAVSGADAVVTRLPSELGLLAASTARQLGKPYVVEVVGCAWDGCVHHGSPAVRMYAPLFYHRTRRAVANAPLVLYVTSDWLQRRYPTRGFHTFASNVEILPLGEHAEYRRQQRLAELIEGRQPRLGTVAALTVKTKGIQTAIAALAKLRAEGLDFRYAVLGPGAPEPWQTLAREAGVADLVSFDGTRRAGEGVRRWLDDLDVYLQPSFQEGLPRATIEAMSRGVACIGSRCGGIPELLPHDRTHEPGDVAGLASCIKRLATDPAVVARASGQDLDVSRSYDAAHLSARRAILYSRLRGMVAGR